MIVQRHFRHLRRLVGEQDAVVDGAVEDRQQRWDERVVRGGRDRVVEFLLGVVPQRILVSDHLFVERAEAEDLLKILFACAQGSVIRRLRFDHQTHLVKILRVHVRVLDLQDVVIGVNVPALRHECADAAAHFDKTARRKDAKRFAERRAADVQFRGKLELVGQLVARREPSVYDHFGKPVRDADGQRIVAIGHKNFTSGNRIIPHFSAEDNKISEKKENQNERINHHQNGASQGKAGKGCKARLRRRVHRSHADHAVGQGTGLA